MAVEAGDQFRLEASTSEMMGMLLPETTLAHLLLIRSY